MSEPLRLRVLTYNIHGCRPATGPVNVAAIADVIRALEPDVAALQEVHRFLPPWNTLRDQPRELGSLLEMEAAFLPSFRLGKAGYGNALLSRHPIRELRRIRLPRGGEPRAALLAELDVDGMRLRLLNTHLEFRETPRGRHAAALAALVRSLEPPLILAGDLNAGAASPELRSLEDAGLVSCGAPDLLTYPAASPVECLDHILVTPDIRVSSCTAIRTTASDHFPLLADLAIPCRRGN